MAAELIPLTRFFAEHGPSAQEEFISLFGGGFLLIRIKGAPPAAVFLPRQDGFTMKIGSDEDVDLSFEEDQTLDAQHATLLYHRGFRGWTIEDHETSFGTHVGKERLQKGRPHLLQDRDLIKLGGGIVEMQFYLAETLWKRMHKAGITKSLHKKPSGEVPGGALPKKAPTPPPELEGLEGLGEEE